MRSEIVIDSVEEIALRQELEVRTDAESQRMIRFLNMPDLSRTLTSPLGKIKDLVKNVDAFKDFDDIKIPEIVPANITFDLFNMPVGHAARSKSDTYYVNDENILRTHDTVMWYYYLNNPEIKERLAKQESVGVLCYGKVYRKDEIDRRHMNIFHQMGGLYLVPDSEKTLTLHDLEHALTQVAISIFGPDVKYRFNPDTFPYTDPSLEMEIEVNGQWVEMLGGGLPRREVLSNFGISGYNGWAFGFGLERLAIASMSLPDIRLLWSEDPRVIKQLELGKKFQEVSKYPPITRDISFIVDKSFVPNDYFDLIRDIVGDMIEEVTLLDKYENAEKFGADKISYTYRIIYRRPDRTLTVEDVEPLQNRLYEQTKALYNATLR